MAQNSENGAPLAKKVKLETDADSAQKEVDPNVQLVRMLCVDLLPLNLFEGNGFQEFIKSISNYTIPKKISLDIIRKEYRRTKSLLMETLASVHHVAISIDTWKLGVMGRRSGRTMWTATAHFIFEGKPISQILFTKEANLRKDFSIAKEIKEELDKYKVFRKVVCFTISNHGNSITLRQAVHSLQKTTIICVASSLNSFMKEAFTFLSEHTALEKDEQLSWHNQYINLNDIIQGNSGDYVDHEIKLLGECLKILEPFNELNNTLSTEQYLTLSFIIPLIVGLKLQISEISPTIEVAKEFLIKVKEWITKYFGTYENELIAEKATFMDPRFDNKTVFITQEKVDSVQQAVIKELKEGESPGLQQSPVPSASDKQSGERGNLLSYLVDHKNIKAEPNVTSSRAQTAVEHYACIPSCNTYNDPYQFWEEFNHVSRCKELYNMSQKYLCIPATAIPVESTSGQFLWKQNDSNNINFYEHRNLLELDNINEILFLHSYYSRNK